MCVVMDCNQSLVGEHDVIYTEIEISYDLTHKQKMKTPNKHIETKTGLVVNRGEVEKEKGERGDQVYVCGDRL